MIPMLGNTGVNPFEGCEPSVPEGEKLDFGSEDFRQYERLGENGLPCSPNSMQIKASSLCGVQAVDKTGGGQVVVWWLGGIL